MKPFTSKRITLINYGSPLENKGKTKPTSKLEEASDRQLLDTPGEEAKALLRKRARKLAAQGSINAKNKEQK